MALITLQNAQLAYGHWPLLDHTDFSLEARERVGLIGDNGSGKTTLFKLITGAIQADTGERSIARTATIPAGQVGFADHGRDAPENFRAGFDPRLRVHPIGTFNQHQDNPPTGPFTPPLLDLQHPPELRRTQLCRVGSIRQASGRTIQPSSGSV